MPDDDWYGILVYGPKAGGSPIDDPAKFDGWYRGLPLAREAYEYHKPQFPGALIFIVKQVDGVWGTR